MTDVVAPTSDNDTTKANTVAAHSSPQCDSPRMPSPELEPESRRMWSASALGRDLQRSSQQVNAQLRQRQQQQQRKRRPHTAQPGNRTDRVTAVAFGRHARTFRPESAFVGGRAMHVPRSGVIDAGAHTTGPQASTRMRPKSSPAGRKQMVRSRLKDHWFSEHLVPHSTAGQDTKFGAEFGISVGVSGLLRGREQHRHHRQPSTKGALQ